MGAQPAELTYTFFLRPHLADLLCSLTGSTTHRAVRDAVSSFALSSLGTRPALPDGVNTFARPRKPYRVVLSDRQVNKPHSHLDVQGMLRFEQLVQHLWNHMLWSYVDGADIAVTRFGAHRRGRIKQGVDQFLATHNVHPDHFNADAALIQFWRMRKDHRKTHLV